MSTFSEAQRMLNPAVRLELLSARPTTIERGPHDPNA